MSTQETSALPTPSVLSEPNFFQKAVKSQTAILLFVLVVLYCYFGFRNNLFFSSGEASNLITDFSGLVLLAIAETFVIISGGIDLSVGSTGAIAGVVGAEVMKHYSASWGLTQLLLLGTLVCAAVGTVVGVINALLITYIRLVPFVATLVTFSAGTGYALVVSGGGDVADVPGATIWSAKGFWHLTWLDLIILIVMVGFCLVLRFTRFGRYTYAIGSNPFAARAAGINMRRHIASIYVISGFLAGLVGMFFFIRLGAGSPTTGGTANLQAIACVVIGGVALTGGSGSVINPLLGCAILTIVGDGLIFINVQPTWNQVVVGGIIALAVGVTGFSGVRSRR